jgi:hypothetical protein
MSNMQPASGQGLLPGKSDTARRLGSVACRLLHLGWYCVEAPDAAE